jgi:DNA-binding HxlR family transcriptional regulator
MKKNQKNILYCPFMQTMEILGGKWKFPILHELIDGKILRFKELERSVTGITPRMLVKELKDLEKNKIVKRKAYATVPPTVEYSLTELGRTLKPILTSLDDWGRMHFESNSGIKTEALALETV